MHNKIHGRHSFMVSTNIMLNTINDVKNFVNLVSKYDFEVDLTSGRYVIDAKSIMGIFSLDLSKPIKLDARCDPDSKFVEEIKPFTIK
jgi:phosphocarrier protein HPr